MQMADDTLSPVVQRNVNFSQRMREHHVACLIRSLQDVEAHNGGETP